MGPNAATEQLSETKRRLLDALLNRECPVGRAKSETITRRNVSVFAPLSYAQEEIWRRTLNAANKPPFYNESITIHREGPLDVGVLQRSFAEIVRRHEIWRTTFDVVDGQPVQIIHAALENLAIAAYDLRRLPESSKEKEALRLAAEQAQKRFDLKTGPLLRVKVLHLDDTHHRVCVTAHQIIVDGVSVFRVFPLELIKLYEAFAKGHTSPLPEPAIQYRDFANWQKEFVTQQILDQQLSYWRQQLAGELASARLSRGRQWLATQTCRGSILPGEWPRSLAEQLRKVCREEGVSLFMLLLAGFVLMWYRYTKQDDLIVGTLAPAGREQPTVQGLLGCFLNPVPLRFRITQRMTFRDLLYEAREVVSGAVANDDVPFYRIAEAVEARCNLSAGGMFDAVISLSPNLPNLGPGWDQTFMDVESGGSAWNLYLELNERPGGLIFRTQYNPNLFDADAIWRMTANLRAILEASAAEPGKTVSELARNNFGKAAAKP